MSKQKIRLVFNNGAEAVVEVEHFSAVRSKVTGRLEEWKATGIEKAFGFNPEDLTFWQEL